MNKIVTRFSPSPTGKLHIGGIRTCLYSYLYAKKNNGKFIIRIEDTDSNRFDPDAENYIKKTLDWLGIIPDEDPWIGGINGPYRQTERDYSNEIKLLLERGNAYYAFDSSNDLDLVKKNNPNFSYNYETRMNMRNSLSLTDDEVDELIKNKVPYVIRFKVIKGIEISFNDEIRGSIKFNTDVIDDKVLVKSNGIPTYHLANTSDDYNMGVTHVIRGEEWLPSTPIHILIYNALGRKIPTFAHLPLILNPDGKSKLSKRSALKNGIPVVPFGGDGLDDKGNVVSYKGFSDEGFDSRALLNFLALIGWNPGHDKEIMTMDDMISSFSLDRVHKSGARFDLAKATWVNSQWIQSLVSDDYLTSDVTDRLKTLTDDQKTSLINETKKRCNFQKDFAPIVDGLFNRKDNINIDDADMTTLDNVIEALDKVADWTFDNISNAITDYITNSGLKSGKLLGLLRKTVVYNSQGIDVKNSMFILGKTEVLNRLKGYLMPNII